MWRVPGVEVICGPKVWSTQWGSVEQPWGSEVYQKYIWDFKLPAGNPISGSFGLLICYWSVSSALVSRDKEMVFKNVVAEMGCPFLCEGLVNTKYLFLVITQFKYSL